MDVAISAGRRPPALNSQQREQLPGLVDWDAAGEHLEAIEQVLSGSGLKGSSVAHTARALNPAIAQENRPIQYLETLDGQIRALRKSADGALASALPEADGRAVELGSVLEQASAALQLQALAARQKLHLLDRHHPEATRLIEELAVASRLERALGKAAEPNAAWTRKLDANDTRTALDIARKHEPKFWSFLSGQWRGLKRRIKAQYGADVLSYVGTLERLAEEHKAAAAVAEHHETIRDRFGLADVTASRQSLEPYWNGEASPSGPVRPLIEACLRDPQAAAGKVMELVRGQPSLTQIDAQLGQLFVDHRSLTTVEIDGRVADVNTARDALPEICGLIGKAAAANYALTEAWRALPIDVDDLHLSIVNEGVTRTLRSDRIVERLDSAALLGQATQLADTLRLLRDLNAKSVLEDRRQQFRDCVIAGGDFAKGQQFLEHQFSLDRPSAAMRSFLTGEAELVVGEIKPIWMMSPLSVADTLPLADELFDVVVFDEASQIPLEDSLPTLYRVRQCIVVGDEMQLPPTSFFASRGDDGSEDIPDYLAFGMTADSLLTKAIPSLPSTRLDWHYRSQHEALIGFCNQALYGGGLKTVPSRQPLLPLEAIATDKTDKSATLALVAARVTGRPISYHRMTNGTYKDQQNLAEAADIAKLIQALLAKGDGKSIAVVAIFRRASSRPSNWHWRRWARPTTPSAAAWKTSANARKTDNLSA